MMGDPKKQRKKYEKPRFPWRIDVLQQELRLIGQYGLRNKRELWRHRTMLSKYRGIARSILGMRIEDREKLEEEVMKRLRRLGLSSETTSLDAVFDLSVESILERRLQTLVFRRNLTNSIHQARQLIVHGHVAVSEKKVTSPSYLVLKEEEAKIAYASTSPFSKPNHPLRKNIDIKVENVQTT
jgi:small subunit ribosomal protein S4